MEKTRTVRLADAGAIRVFAARTNVWWRGADTRRAADLAARAVFTLLGP
jgi:hypothetical protein